MNVNMTREEYLDLNYKERRRIWIELIGNSDLRLFGRVKIINNNITVVENTRSITKDKTLASVSNPLEYGYPIDEVIGLGNISEEIQKKEVKTGNYIVFTIQVQPGKIRDNHALYVIKKGSVSKMENADLAEILPLPETEQSHVFTDFIVDSDGILQYVSPKIKELFKKISINITNIRAEKESITNELTALELDFKERKLQQDNELEIFKQEKTTKINQELAELEAVKTKLEGYRLFHPTVQVEDLPLEKQVDLKIEDHKEALQHVQQYLVSNETTPLYYDMDTILQLYAGLKTDQLVVLAGSPGTGKSSLVVGFADAIGAEFRMVPVQPNWVDKSDLLGFYNPIEKTYISTPFLDAILEAKKEENKDNLFIICLDELNLAHVEYYFAEFLSKLQTDRTIELYSRNIKKDIEDELQERYGYFEQSIHDLSIKEFLQQNEKIDIENYFQMKKQLQLIHKYDPVLKIPKNIRFVGTLNKDETTKDLSPKVIDRSFFIWINSFRTEDMIKLQQELESNQTKNVRLAWKVGDLDVRKVDTTERLQKYIKTMAKELEPFGIYLTNRFQRTAQQLAGIEIFNPSVIKDIIHSSLVLPKVSVDSYETDLDNLLFLLESKNNGQMEHSEKLLKEMIVRESNGSSGKLEMITYWR